MSHSLCAEGTPVVPDGVVALPVPPKIKLDVAYHFSNIICPKKRQSELDFVDVVADADISLNVDSFAFKISDDSEPALAAAVAGEPCVVRPAGSN